MLIHSRPIAITAAVISFFVLSFVGLFTGLVPFTCCKRAFLGAALVYIVTAIVVNIINAILTSAIIDSHINKRRETDRVG
jgi:uncharacterized membrane protein